MSSDDIAIRVNNLSKRYHLYDSPRDRLKQFMLPRIQKLFGLMPKSYFREFWALKDVSFEVRRGETVGIIGRNGAGKSTLLQVICGILTPTRGGVETCGRVAALLELGSGFNPEFTGRENIYINGAVLGLSREQIDRRFDEITSFADIGAFLDQPLKVYSSGMKVRLAFAVAININPDILIIDEALSVGDVYFQRKCQQRIKEFQESGGTLLFVTHSTDSLMRICHRGIVLDGGALIRDGGTKEAVSVYMRTVFGSHGDEDGDAHAEDMKDSADSLLQYLLRSGDKELFKFRPGYNRDEIRLGDGKAVVADFAVYDGQTSSPVVYSGDRLTLLLKYVFREDLERLIFGVTVQNAEGVKIYACNTFLDKGQVYSFNAGTILISEVSLSCAIAPGNYFLTVGVSQFNPGSDEISAIDRRVDSIALTVLARQNKFYGIADMNFSFEIKERLC